MQTVDIKTDRRPTRDAQKRTGNQSLHFHRKRTVSIGGHNNRCAAKFRVARAQEKSGRILNNLHSPVAHFKNNQFLIRAKPVFQHPEQPERKLPVSFQRNYSIHHMLKQFRPGKLAIFSHMPHQQQGGSTAPAKFNQLRCHRPHLRYRTRQTFHQRRGHRLYGIHNKQGRGASRLHLCKEIVKPAGSNRIGLGRKHAKALCSGLDLPKPFFPAGVQHFSSRCGHCSRNLQK